MKKTMNYLKQYAFFLVLLLMTGTSLYSQAVTGTVTDSNGTPLPGASVLAKGTTNGVQTDFDGNYSISGLNSNSILVFSYIGFVTQEIDVAGRSIINVTLQDDTQNLDEVVVIGYGTVRKSDLTGAVAKVKAEDLNPGVNTSVDQALQGRVAGVQISQASNEPGGGLNVNIRGAGSIGAGTQPLYVIDGVIVNNQAIAATGGNGFTGNNTPRNPLNALNPNDVESIEVLKDASATAIYGVRGSNGVVIITTKKGTAGKLKVGYNTYVGFQNAEEYLDILTANEYQNTLNAIIDAGGGDPSQVINEIEGGGTDWQELIYRTALIQNHDITFTGGSENLSYFASLNYFDQEGLVEGSRVKRYSTRLNLNYNDDKKLRAGMNLNLSFINDDFASTGTGINENGGAIYTAINYDPVISPFDANGDFQRSNFFTGDNPLAILAGEDAFAETFRFTGNVFLEYFLMPELSAKVLLGADTQNVRRDVFIQPFTLAGTGTGGIATINTGRRDYMSVEGTLNYNKEFGSTRLNAVLGATYEYFQNKSFQGTGQGFALPDLGTNAIGTGDPLLNSIGSGRNQDRFISYLGRVNLAIADKYLLTGTFRNDGSSRFGPNQRFQTFFSGAFAWKLHNEGMFEGVDWINELKPRFSIGSTGNIPNQANLFLSTLSPGNGVLFGNNFLSTLEPSRLENPDLSWESAVQYDIGIDFGFLNNRISGSIDYFDKETTDLIVQIPQPLNTGFVNQFQNLGGISNKGLEFTLNLDLVRSEKVNWGISGNVATLENEVLDTGQQGDIIRGGVAQIPNFSLIRAGETLDSYFGLIVDGIWQEGDDFSVTTDNVAPGDIRYRDLNGDGTINGEDRDIIGNPIPDLTWGLTSNLRVGNVTLDVVMQGVEGVDRLNANLANSLFPNNFRQNRIAEPLLNRWTPENPSNQYPSGVNPLASGGINAVVSTLTVEDASYFRLQSVRLGYNVPTDRIKWFNSLSFYITGQNLLTVSDYLGVDPAANASGSNTTSIDFNAYPVPRTFLLGLNVEF